MGYSEGPDRGHAWVIACAAMVITMILSGISKMVGILYVAVIETYGVTRKEATLPFTFRKSLRCLAGPIVGIVGQRYGIRTVTLGGAVIASLGAFLSFFAPNVTWLAVCWGGVHGLGEAFANTLFQVVVNQYFEKYRSTASGIALSGACLGSVMFSFLIEALREAYGLQGTFLVLSGVILHVLPAAILLRSPSWIRNGTPKPNTEMTELKGSFKNQPRMYVITDDYIKSNAEKRMSTVSLNPRLLEKNEIMNISNVPTKSHSTTNLVESLEKKLDGCQGYDNLAFAMERQKNPEKAPLEKRLSIQNIFATSKESLYEKAPSVYNLKQEPSLKNVSIEQDSPKKENSENEKSMLQSLRTIAKLYTNPIFLLICVCMATYVFIFIPIMTSMVDYSKDKGLPETVGKYLIHAMAVGDIIGRLCFGWVTDKDLISIPRYMTLTLILQGVFIILLPFAFNLASFLALLAFYSMTAGSMLVRLPVLVLKHVKKEEQSVAMGCYGFASGLVPLGVPSLIGHFRDNFGSYDGMYYLLGSLSIVSGAFWLLEPVLARLNQRLEERRENSIKV
ncbi:monocarboxylate transporter 9 [Trichonephila inaurata madagascariensis]|uniref:Monocarboxylate transporter 9 n=1 Tax=Trichonephila inaurata madagascariensis TaxID=2747483 RepID=A0A8X7CD49_9ARAC|nr:monocarboxylate transporter 9 [Trichonephila inaurata madagascariensis]